MDLAPDWDRSAQAERCRHRAELQLHAELAAAAGDRRNAVSDMGGSSDPAARAAHAMDAIRDQRGLPWLEDLLRDLRSGLLAAAVVASYLPARLVAEISSVEALKSE